MYFCLKPHLHDSSQVFFVTKTLTVELSWVLIRIRYEISKVGTSIQVLRRKCRRYIQAIYCKL